MDAIFKKLNYKDQPIIHVLNAPGSFAGCLHFMEPLATVKHQIGEADAIEFVIVFAINQAEVDAAVHAICPKLRGDAVVWMCYPKGSSKRYKCEFNRDTGWQVFGQYGMEGVRMVAIDEDWSALRFRKVEFIKNFTRQFGALSDKGKERAGQ
ncbi:MAG: hypothetical protein IPN76_25260 [Saprospiraceae bacterium]|nr:hypothetical protein [Saprospiraceae bacterium]